MNLTSTIYFMVWPLFKWFKRKYNNFKKKVPNWKKRNEKKKERNEIKVEIKIKEKKSLVEKKERKKTAQHWQYD